MRTSRLADRLSVAVWAIQMRVSLGRTLARLWDRVTVLGDADAALAEAVADLTLELDRARSAINVDLGVLRSRVDRLTADAAARSTVLARPVAPTRPTRIADQEKE